MKHRSSYRTHGWPVSAQDDDVNRSPSASPTPTGVGRTARRSASARQPPRDGRLLDTLLAAFHDDPLYRWLYPDETTRPRALGDNFTLILSLARERGRIDTTSDGSTVAVWTEPGVALLDDPLPFVDLLDRWAPRRRDTALEGMERCGDFARQTDQTLHVLAVHPAQQGRGAAARLLGPTLADLDRSGVPAYLESTNVRNVTFYTRCGFGVLAKVAVPGGGPLVRPMRREAADTE